ncbi:MAG: hypothetical protein WDN31_00420 [Hyphomicrobium sp.]
MPALQPRYGRPRGSGLDDSHQLESIAALLAANPALKPTTAIRSLGIEDPSVIRRLRDKFRMDQARLMANARRSFRNKGQNGRLLGRATPRAPARQRPHDPAGRGICPCRTTILPSNPVHVAQQQPLPAILCDLGLWALTTAIEQQAVLARHWLRLPAVENAMRGQLGRRRFSRGGLQPTKTAKAAHPLSGISCT